MRKSTSFVYWNYSFKPMTIGYEEKRDLPGILTVIKAKG